MSRGGVGGGSRAGAALLLLRGAEPGQNGWPDDAAERQAGKVPGQAAGDVKGQGQWPLGTQSQHSQAAAGEAATPCTPCQGKRPWLEGRVTHHQGQLEQPAPCR